MKITQFVVILLIVRWLSYMNKFPVADPDFCGRGCKSRA